ncbi:MAG: putative lipid II flippase FtsW [Acidimicrobiales bacterium]|nr:putative lipid II flippase FtsW [Acidimicrobiales bacterium]
MNKKLQNSRPLAGPLITVVVMLSVLGLAMVLSASSIDALQLYGSPWTIFFKQVMWMLVGASAMVFTATKISMKNLQRVSSPFLVLCFIGLFAVLIPGLGVYSAGSTRWIGVGILKVQPSELMKLALVLFGASLLSRRKNQIEDWKSTTRPLVIVSGTAITLIMFQPDMGTSIVIGCIFFSLLFAAGAPGRVLALVGISGGVVGSFLAFHSAYRRERLLSFMHPLASQTQGGYQVVQSLVGMGSGHLFGVGLGASTVKWGFLPNDHTDFIFAVIGQELGLVGSLFVLSLFGTLGYIGFTIAKETQDEFSHLLAIGITAWILSQAFINIGAVIGGLPVTGIPLPLVSFGGSSLVGDMAALGILVAIAKNNADRNPTSNPRPKLKPELVRS